jgi:hypothetical protein
MRPQDGGRRVRAWGQSNYRISLKCPMLAYRRPPDVLRIIRNQITNVWNSTARFCRPYCAGIGALTFLVASRRCDTARRPSESLITLNGTSKAND